MSFKAKSTELVTWTLSNQKEIEILPVWVMDTGRLNEKRPAYVKMAVPDDYVKNLNGVDPQHIYLMVKIPYDVHEEWINWSSQPSGIRNATSTWIGGPDPEPWNKVTIPKVVHNVDESGEPADTTPKQAG